MFDNNFRVEKCFNNNRLIILKEVKMKIAIVQKDFYIGGIPSACISLLEFLSKEKDIETTLFTFDKIKDIELPSNINVVYANKSLKVFAVSNAESKKRGLFFRLKWLFVRLWCKLFTNKIPLKIALGKQKKIDEMFDLVVAFSPSTNSRTFCFGAAEFTLEKINARTKCVIFHNDFRLSGFNTEFVVNGLSKFDKILCVSKSCAEDMKEALPKLSNKIDYVYNIVDVDKVRQKSKEFQVLYPDNVINIVSVSRLSEEKAHLRSLIIFKQLREKYKNFVWHIVGDGKERKNLERYVSENDMQSYIHFYGNQTNPYPYMKSADLFYLGSYHEAAPIVFAESMAVSCPVLTTKTLSADELVGELGFVCENSEIGIYKKLEEILKNKNILNEKKELLKNYEYDNTSIVERIKNLTY